MLVERGVSSGGGGARRGGESEEEGGGGAGGVFVQPAARVASVVDTTGAGDCFTAAYCVAWLREGGEEEMEEEEEGQPEQEQRQRPERQQKQQRLRFATAAAALCVSRAGALPSMPSLREVESFLESWGEGL